MTYSIQDVINNLLQEIKVKKNHADSLTKVSVDSVYLHGQVKGLKTALNMLGYDTSHLND